MFGFLWDTVCYCVLCESFTGESDIILRKWKRCFWWCVTKTNFGVSVFFSYGKKCIFIMISSIVFNILLCEYFVESASLFKRHYFYIACSSNIMYILYVTVVEYIFSESTLYIYVNV